MANNSSYQHDAQHEPRLRAGYDTIHPEDEEKPDVRAGARKRRDDQAKERELHGPVSLDSVTSD